MVHENTDISLGAVACLVELTSPAMSVPPTADEEAGLAKLVEAIVVSHTHTHRHADRHADRQEAGAGRHI